MNILEIVFGQIPEAMFFILFLIFVKGLKENLLQFVIFMCIDYILLMELFPYNIWSHILYFVITFIILKVLYKNKADITDVFTLGIASIVIIVVSTVVYFPISLLTTNIIIGNIIQKVILFLILFTHRNKLRNINKLYHKLWNRTNTPRIMKSATFRALNVVLFNMSFYIINFGMLMVIALRNWR